MNCVMFFCICLVLFQFAALFTLSVKIIVSEEKDECFNETCGVVFDPQSPLVNCSYLPEEFLDCKLPPPDFQGNKTARDEQGYGCVKWGGQKYEDVELTRIRCTVLEGIECYGDRSFLSIKQYPCVKYTGHYFVTTLIYSVLLGILGMDRFCLGHTGTAVGKLLTLGGFGFWWTVDIVLLVLGYLLPADDSSWMPYY